MGKLIVVAAGLELHLDALCLPVPSSLLFAVWLTVIRSKGSDPCHLF